MRIRPTYTFVDPVESDDWHRLVEGCASSLFHSPQWAQVVRNTYGFNPAACVMRRGGDTVAGVAWADVDGFGGPRRVTFPFSDRCDILAATLEDATELVQHVMPDETLWTVASLNSSPLPEIANSRCVRSARMQTIDVSPDADSLWTNLSPAARRGVRKAQKQGVETCVAQDIAQLRKWYDLHLRLRKHKHRVLPQPFAFFEHIWGLFVEKGHGFLLLAVLDGKITGGTLYLRWKDKLYYKFNASDISLLQTRPNNLLMWRGIELAKETGCTALDLGRTSNGQDGLFRFKESFGAFSEDLSTVAYGLTPETEKRSEEAHLALSKVTEHLTDPSLPDEVAETAGQLLYRNFA